MSNKSSRLKDLCKTCTFFVKETEGVVVVNATPAGHCRRYPPTVTLLVVPGGQVVPATTFPSVQADMWCGEHIDNIEF